MDANSNVPEIMKCNIHILISFNIEIYIFFHDVGRISSACSSQAYELTSEENVVCWSLETSLKFYIQTVT